MILGMSSLFICNPVNLTQEDLNKITSGSGISPAAFAVQHDGSDESKARYDKIAEALHAAEQRERRTATINRLLGVGSLSIAALGLFLSWRSMRARD